MSTSLSDTYGEGPRECVCSAATSRSACIYFGPCAFCNPIESEDLICPHAWLRRCTVSPQPARCGSYCKSGRAVLGLPSPGDAALDHYLSAASCDFPKRYVQAWRSRDDLTTIVARIGGRGILCAAIWTCKVAVPRARFVKTSLRNVAKHGEPLQGCCDECLVLCSRMTSLQA